MYRIGIVTERDIVNCRVRVQFPEDDVVSPWAQVIQPTTVQAQFFRLPDLEEQVMCLIGYNGDDVFVMGSLYTDSNQPSETGESITAVAFEDGTVIKYDTSNKTLTVNVQGGNITVDGDVNLTGNLDVSGNIEAGGDVRANGQVRAFGNIIAGPNGAFVTLLGHVHAGAGTPPTPNT